jgi:hypothetical protein
MKTKAKHKMPNHWRRVDHFFGWFDAEFATEKLWEILKLALTNGNEDTEVKERSNMIFFFEYTKELYENVGILLQKEKEKYIKK